MKKFAVIVAGGMGQRMGVETPKQFLMLRGKPVLWYSINTFLSAYDDMQIILVLPLAHLESGVELRNSFENKDRIQIISGGVSRFHSVQNGLKAIKDKSVVFVHDGVRCLLTKDLIRNCYQQAIEKGSAVPAVSPSDSIRIVDGEKTVVADRSNVRMIQTPQTFKSEIILPAFEQEFNHSFTDEATVVEATGKEIFLIEGEYNNIKITRPIDLVIAEKILEERSVFE
ncbi:2-C-methyl-D-erythritol 4-phosphate cytidylyltransferase 2 [mine drainage metagenome]|uniref:2-C-methyl-D-erythritol 4-phosphate cytidylyltransferase 2 n=1 Tax=mine drainage metagenome TaxID=410659 RepID=A0A1J5SKX3_9ZZZZ